MFTERMLLELTED